MDTPHIEPILGVTLAESRTVSYGDINARFSAGATLRIVLTVLALFFMEQAHCQPYVKTHLPKNVSIELPRNWVVMSNNQRNTLDAFVVARQGNTAIADFRADLAFAANYYDDGGKTAGIVNVRYYADQTVTQIQSRNALPAELREIDGLLQRELEKGVALSGNRILAWLGTSRQTINGLVTFVSEYRRSGANGSFRVRLVRVLDAGQSFTLTVSFREDQAYFLQPISDYITQSLRR